MRERSPGVDGGIVLGATRRATPRTRTRGRATKNPANEEGSDVRQVSIELNSPRQRADQDCPEHGGDHDGQGVARISREQQGGEDSEQRAGEGHAYAAHTAPQDAASAMPLVQIPTAVRTRRHRGILNRREGVCQ